MVQNARPRPRALVLQFGRVASPTRKINYPSTFSAPKNNAWRLPERYDPTQAGAVHDRQPLDRRPPDDHALGRP